MLLAGQTGSSLTFASVGAGDTGSYSVTVMGSLQQRDDGQHA